ncbi:MAG TPA: hypothetical protein VFP68_02615, partial [Burkholderiaceae bacterium]|nr:hypothetical protein [Burkholderiaceae bacterium]
WLDDPCKVQLVLGRDGYREAMLSLLEQAQPGDCVAAGFREDAGDAHRAHFNSDELYIVFHTSPDGLHRAVLWAEPDWPGAALWIDGRWIVGPKMSQCDRAGQWVDERVFAVQVPGPEDHRGQGLDFGGLGMVRGLLVVDASAQRYRILEPSKDEHWASPWLVKEGGRWLVYPECKGRERGDMPSRVFGTVDDLLGAQ